jgi:hypothetical protein
MRPTHCLYSQLLLFNRTCTTPTDRCEYVWRATDLLYVAITVDRHVIRALLRSIVGTARVQPSVSAQYTLVSLFRYCAFFSHCNFVLTIIARIFDICFRPYMLQPEFHPPSSPYFYGRCTSSPTTLPSYRMPRMLGQRPACQSQPTRDVQLWRCTVFAAPQPPQTNPQVTPGAASCHHQ